MNANQLPSPNHDPNWKGYTLEELNYRRAYNAARLEIQKQRIASNYRHLATNFNPTVKATGLMGKILGSLSVLDYGLMAFKLGKRILSITGRFRKRR